MSHGALLVIGSGPGIGVSTASVFAEKGFKHVVLLSRNTDRLAQDSAAVASAGAQVETLQIDLSADEKSIKSVLARIDGVLSNWGTRLEVVLYNGARVGPSKLLEWERNSLEEDLRVSCVVPGRCLQRAMYSVPEDP